jgi:phosphoserine aminotransferase
MQQTFFTVGPSQLFPTVNEHIVEAIEQQIGSLSHRSGKFEDIFSSAVSNLKELLSIPENYSIFFVSSGTEAMERTIENVVEKYSLHFVNGAFSQRFFDTAIELGKQAKKIEVKLGEGFTSYQLPTTNYELICFTHNETSTGVMLPAQEIAAIKKHYPNKLVAIDVVSSAPYGNIDYTYADIVFFSVQKLFGLPAGLGIMVVSPHALEKATYVQKKKINIGTYHNFPTLKKWADKNQTLETPSVLHMFLFNKVLEDLLTIGIKQIRKKTDEKAALLYNFFDNHPIWNSFVTEKTFRSPTVIVANVGQDQKKIKEYLKNNNMIVGSGYGIYKDTQIRIANFPSLSQDNIQALLTLCKTFG